MSVVIRPATLSDATHLAAFVDMAGEGLPTYLWSGMASVGQSPFEIGRERARRDVGDFSWRNAWIAEVNGDIAGALIGFRIPDSADPEDFKELPDFLRPLAELEAEAPGRWYVNVLAVFPEYRGRGIGAALLAQADALGKATAPAGMAIIVASENTPAVKLYEKAGYRTVARRPLDAVPGYKRGGDWVLLTKPHS